MTKTFTPEFMAANCGCYDQEQLAACSFMATNPITLESIIHSEIPLKDKYWFVCRKVLTKEQNQQVAIYCAELVLPIFEKRYPEDKRPREAIEAAKAFIAGYISIEQLLEKRNAAADAATYAAADAATYAAADAAAAAAADAAAAAAAYAAAYAYTAAAADEIKQQLFDYLINLCA